MLHQFYQELRIVINWEKLELETMQEARYLDLGMVINMVKKTYSKRREESTIPEIAKQFLSQPSLLAKLQQ